MRSEILLELNPKVFLLALLAFMALTVLAFLLLRLLRRHPLLAKFRLPSSLFALALLLAFFLRNSSLPTGPVLDGIIQILLLLTGAYLGVKALEVAAFDIFLTHWRGVKPPAILGNLFSFVLCLVSFFLVLHYVLRVNLTPILATSAIFTAVIGLALQDILGNLFSGLVFQMEKSFEVGDWVRVGDRLGRVAEMNWRSIKLQTQEDDFVIIPNSSLSREMIINHTQPHIPHARVLKVGLAYGIAPSRARKAIEETAQSVKGILPQPKPQIRVKAYGDFAIDYEIQFWIADFSQFDKIEGDFLGLLWYRLDRADICVPFPTQHLYLHPFSHQVQRDQRSEISKEILQVLQGIEILSPLNPVELEKAASRVRVERYCAQEMVLHQGDPGDSFFAIKEGEVEVSVGDYPREHRVLARLGKGDIFGEMSLLTGATRSANIVALRDCEFLVLDKNGFQDIVAANPTIAQALSVILAKRRQELDQEMAKQVGMDVEEERRSILKKIRAFFGLG
jgi:small-conductance mechanosensitive channel/CRP-like cAMP-binding protein